MLCGWAIHWINPKIPWLELEHKNGNSNKQQDHCSSRELHLSQINTRSNTFQKLPSQDQVSWMIWVILSCCHMFYSMTNGPKTPQTSNILQKATLVQAHTFQSRFQDWFWNGDGQRCQSKVMHKGNQSLQHLPCMEGTGSRTHLLQKST